MDEQFGMDTCEPVSPDSPNEYKNDLSRSFTKHGRTLKKSQSVTVVERISQIVIKTSEDSEYHTGCNLHTVGIHHRIQVTDPENEFVKKLGLSDGDIIIGLNNIDIRHYDHELILEHMKDLCDVSEGKMSLVVARLDFEIDYNDLEEISEDTLIEIIIEFEYLPRGQGILKLTAHILKASFKSFRPIKNVRYTGSNVYLIRSVHETGQYLQVTDDGSINITSLTSHNDRRFQFIIYRFCGSRKRKNGQRKEVFLCMIQSNVPDNKRWICATGIRNIGLTNPMPLEYDVPEIRRADSRFFKVLKCKNDYIFESLENEGTYLSWEKDKLSRKIYSSSEMTFAENYSSIQFAVFKLDQYSS